MTKLDSLLSSITEIDGFDDLLSTSVDADIVGVRAIAAVRPAIAAAAFSVQNRTVAVVFAGAAEAERFALSAADYLPEEKVVNLVDWESYPFEAARPDVSAIGKRADVFRRLVAGESLLVCVAVSTLMQKIPVPADGVYDRLELHPGRQISIRELSALLVNLGYARTPIVENPGEFAVRGSVADIFPAQATGPLRLDFFGDEIETIKAFNVGDQRSTLTLAEAVVNPGREFRLDAAATERVMAAGGLLGGYEDGHRWLPLIHKLGPTVDYFSSTTLWVVNEPKAVFDEGERFHAEQKRALSEGYAGEVRFSAGDYYCSVPELKPLLIPRIETATIGLPRHHLTIDARPAPKVGGDIEKLRAKLDELMSGGWRALLFLSDTGARERLGELLAGMGVPYGFDEEVPGAASLAVGHTAEGYLLPDVRLAVFGHTDIFPKHDVEPPPTSRPRRRSLIDFADLVHGELLVHEVNGIGAFGGLTRKTVGGKTREYVTLDYAAGDRLYLPTDQLHRVSRYIGPEGTRPEITRLGSSEWRKTTGKVRNSLKKLAVDLMALYAKRAEATGHAFSADTEWQRELEAAFPYEATADQASAIRDVKSDMESAKPMDRLVCGDVGYGKTEVAVRAAFKAVLDGKQVMMLVPTTILAQQHYLTFKERFAPFPVRVEMLSRFLSAAEQKDVVKRVKTGVTDMVVGTHRLLQKDIRFKDLGLVVVDEEQRFGVNAKEKLRQLRASVDVITLSATPIPRTLQMSLSGVRDLSLIETPPEGRYPVATNISEFQPGLVAGAIRRELARGGQVFYVHNRVETIERAAAKVESLVPEATIIMGHGQMSETILENVMFKFLDGRADVLVCTTIIESGIDIPSANTLIVEDAERLGLAQLYQLRGRVGRGRHRAHAYFLYRPGRVLTETALERLKTIGEFTELGSGFKVALRDLEIRGAGNILGAEQHGHVISVGFDLYCRMLRREIDRLQGKTEVLVPEVTIELPVNAYLPEAYIEDENLRLELYRAIAGAVSVDEINEIESEMTDRFGPLLLPVTNLLAVASLRFTAASVGITAITMSKGRLVVKCRDVKNLRSSSDYETHVKLATGEIVVKPPTGAPDILKFVIDLVSAIIP